MSEKNKEEIKTTSQPAGAREWLQDKGVGVVYRHIYGGERVEYSPVDIDALLTAYAAQQTAALTDKLCKIQDDIASLVSTHRSDWSWNNVVEDVKKLVEERDNLKKQAAAFELKGWQDAINSVRVSLQQYPNAGGDIEIMQAVEKIVKEQIVAQTKIK